MTTSSILAKTAGKIIEQALRDARIVAVEQPIQDIDNQRGLDALNNVAKYWQTQDINLWLEDQGVLPLIVGQARYLLGPNGTQWLDFRPIQPTMLAYQKEIRTCRALNVIL